MNVKKLGKLAGCAALLALTATATKAQASGFMAARYGADLGHPAAANPFSIYFNPAAISRVKGTKIAAEVGLIYRQMRYTRTEDALSPKAPLGNQRSNAEAPGYRESNTGEAKLDNILALPFLGVTSDLGTDFLGVGYAAYVPFGGQSRWSKNDAFQGAVRSPGAVDGPQRWHNISGILFSLYNTVAVSANLGDSLSIGVNASYIMHTVRTVRAKNAAGDDETNDVSTPASTGSNVEGRSLLDVSGSDFGIGAGLYYTPTDRFQAGFSWTSRPGFGQQRLTGDLKSQQSLGANQVIQKVDLLQTYPDTFRLGFSFSPDNDVTLRLDGEYITWSALKRQCIVNVGRNCDVGEDGSQAGTEILQNQDRGWHDAWALRGGVSTFVTKEHRTEVFASAAYDSSPVPTRTLDPSLYDSPKVIPSVGIQHKVNETLTISSGYTLIYFIPKNTAGGVSSDELSVPSRTPSSDGRYTSQIHVLNLNGIISF